MAIAVKLSDEAVNDARIMANVSHRSTAKQIEHWMQIGKIMEDNPDLTYEFVRDILIAEQEPDSQAEPYVFND